MRALSSQPVVGRRFFFITLTVMLWAGVALSEGASPALAGSAPRPAATRAPSISNIKDEHLRPVAARGPIRVSSAPETTLSAPSSRTRSGLAAATAATGSSVGFLTRPYTTWHNITSVFDHCSPDYTQDNKVCEFDGSVGYRSYGIDPSFSLGYAQSPGGGNYLYYDGHNGWDYSMYYENVLASAEGIVQLAGADPYNPCFGQTITIQHPQGFTTRYAHLSQIYVTPGQNVWRGEVIAQSGNTGCSSGPHLHFGVYVTSSWTAVDPWGWWGAAGADPWPSDAGNLWLTGYAQFPLPSAPGNVNAIAGNASATVSWTPPTFDGGSGISSYTVTTSPGGATQSVGGNTTSAVVTGLTNGTAYTFTVTAVNGVGANQSPASSAVVPSGWMGQYRPMTSLRILDTRYGIGGIASPLGQQATINIPVVGRGDVPAGGVAAVVMNATVTQSTASGYITVYPTGSARPSTSAVNFQTGQTVANLVEMPVGTGGDVTVFNYQGSVHVILDVVGWVASDTSVGTGLLHAVAPARLLDTRVAQRPLGGGQTLDLAVGGQGGVPATGAAAAIVNLTVTNGSASSYLIAYPSGSSRPSTSNLNFGPGQTISNRAIVPLGSGGKITLYNFAGQVHVVVDVVGWFTDSTAAASTSGRFVGMTLARLLDTRSGSGPLQSLETRAVAVLGQGGVPSSGVSAVVLNVTIVNPTAAGFLTVYADQSAPPPTSDLNFPAGALLSNLVVAQVGSDGKIAIYNLTGASHVVVDVLGYYN